MSDCFIGLLLPINVYKQFVELKKIKTKNRPIQEKQNVEILCNWRDIMNYSKLTH